MSTEKLLADKCEKINSALASKKDVKIFVLPYLIPRNEILKMHHG